MGRRLSSWPRRKREDLCAARGGESPRAFFFDGIKLLVRSLQDTNSESHTAHALFYNPITEASNVALQICVMLHLLVSFKYLWGCVCSPLLLLIKVLGLRKCHLRHTRWLAGGSIPTINSHRVFDSDGTPTDATNNSEPARNGNARCGLKVWSRVCSRPLVLPASSWRNYGYSYLAESIFRELMKSHSQDLSCRAKAFQRRRRDSNAA